MKRQNLNISLRFSLAFMLSFMQVHSAFAESDPILSDEPAYSKDEIGKKKKIDSSIQNSKLENDVPEIVTLTSPILELSVLGGYGYAKYGARSGTGSTRAVTAADFVPQDATGIFYAIHGGYISTKRNFGLNIDYRALSVSYDTPKGYNPGDGLEYKRTRFSFTADWLHVWKGFQLKFGYSMWGRSGTETRPSNLTSLYDAHGPTLGVGYGGAITDDEKLMASLVVLGDYALKYYEHTAATGPERNMFIAYELQARLRWQAFTHIGFEITPYARYESVSFNGASVRKMVDAKEEDYSFAVPVGIFFQF